MDLNRSMTELYKKRASTSKRKTTATTSAAAKQSAVDGESRKKLSWPTTEGDAEYVTKITMDQLYGCQQACEEVRSHVRQFKTAVSGKSMLPELPVLICGSRGLGKTSIVEAAAHYAELKIIRVLLKSLAVKTRRGFRIALKRMMKVCLVNQPAIVLIDDLHKLDDKEELKGLLEDALGKLLARRLKLLFFCTALSINNSFSHLKFSDSIQLKKPDLQARYNMLESHRRTNLNLAHLSDEELSSIAVNTPSFSASNIKELFHLAEVYSTETLSLVECEKAIDRVKKFFKRDTHLIGEKPTVTWDKIGGLTEVRQAFQHVLRKIRSGDIDCKFAGLALYGPPGCGKTMVAQAMANEAGLNFIAIKPGELVNKYLGETERNVRRVFSEAREHEPCMIYFDEFDGLCGSRGDKHDLTNTIQTLLSEMDGFDGRGKSIILASTNRIEDIDPAILRSGRLSEHIYVGPPNEQARREILIVNTSKPNLVLGNDLNLDQWARETSGFTGADLAFLVSKAKSFALSLMDDDTGTTTLRQEHFVYAFNKVKEQLKNQPRPSASVKI